jgi:signal transduction histidine kinase
MVLLGLAWFLKGLKASDASLLYTLGFVLAGIYAAVFVHLLLSFPTGRLDPGPQRTVVRAAYVVLGGVVTDHGLAVALEGLAARSPVPVHLDVHLEERLPEAIEVAAYFLVAESLTNVAKYARATKAAVSVRRADGQVVVEIVNHGVGGARIEAGSRLRGLADRMQALDGTLRVFSPESRGTELRAEIPC